MRGPDALLENEAKRIIDLLPEMKPGKHKGKEVDVPYSIPISFRLESTSTSSNLDSKVLEDGFNLTSPDNAKAVYIVDGVETTMKYVQTISPDAIESIAVLKGKAAEDKYDEKGKYGIVEITLKNKE
ncbi:MAG: bla regulator protein BlaR1 [Maribacter sp.]|jgi:bla regulator protein BlaR1